MSTPPAAMTRRVAFAPGRVNLIGDHTDYSGGFACPMAIDLGTTVTLQTGGPAVILRSDAEQYSAVVPLDIADPASVSPAWARYVAAVVSCVAPPQGGTGQVVSNLPIGAGLSSSASLELAVAIAIGADPSDPTALARLCQRAEHLASGVPCGIMDQLVGAAGIAGHALLLDCETLRYTTIPVPEEVEIVVVHSGEDRSLAGSAYAQRRHEVEAAGRTLGRPLRECGIDDLSGLDGEALRRARHVVTENARTLAFATALREGDVQAAGTLMSESHMSLRDDFRVSTERLDALVRHLVSLPGVLGARLTGAGFGGCVVALVEPEALPRLTMRRSWVVHAAAGARLVSPD
ncbi:MAG: galactokinase [Acidimicrobiales bacterium]